MIRTDEGRIVFRTRFETTVIEPYGPNCLRCRSTRNRIVSDENWTLKKRCRAKAGSSGTSGA